MQLEWRSFTKCPLCEGVEFRRRYPLKDVNVFQCLSCRLLFLNPYLSPKSMAYLYSSTEAMRASNERLRHYYDRFEGSETERFYRYSLRLLRTLRDGGSLLDIGCGRGHFLLLAREFGWQVTGLEPSEEQARYAGEQHGLEIVNATLEETHFDQRLFDVITMWDFIEHVPCPKEVMAKTFRWLKKSGYLLIATPNHQSLLNFLADMFYVASGRLIQGPLSYFFLPEHILYFTPATLRKLLSNSGFHLVRDIRTGTDIDRYAVGLHVKVMAKVLLLLAKVIRAENRIVVICQKR